MKMPCRFWVIPIYFFTLLTYAQASDEPVGCPGIGGAKLPTKVTFDDGSVMTVVDRNDGKVHEQRRTSDGKKSDVVTYRGLFLLSFNLPTSRINYNWKQDLPSFFPLKVDQSILADADPRPDPAPNYPTYAVMYSVDMSVIGTDSIRIGACDYPVLKIYLRRAGQSMRPATLYYDPASMLTLRSVIEMPATENAPAQVIDRRAVKLELR